MYNWLNGKKTYIVAAVLIVLNGMVALGYLTPAQIDNINIILGALGIVTLRAGMSKSN